jgi:hypothetical protein
MQEQRFLLITACLVALVGAPAVYSILQEPREALVSQENEGSKSNVDSARAPASVKVEAPLRHNNIRSKSVILDYVCKDKGQVYEVDGTLVRFKGSSCLDQMKDISVINQSNGFTGSIIFLKNKNFTTDFIDLKEGDNQLAIQGTDEKGQKIVKTFVVKRRFPASAEDTNN